MITRLSVARFKAIRSASLELRALNLLCGVNGMGKSTCLQALLLLRQSWLANTLPGVGLLLRGALVDLGRGQDVLHQFEGEESIEFRLTSDDTISTWRFAVEQGRGLEHEVLPLVSDGALPAPSQESYSLAPFTPGFRYLSAERVRPEVAYETSFYSVRELGQIGSRGEYAVHFVANDPNRPLTIRTLRHPSLEESCNDILSNVRSWMSEISPGLSMNFQQFPGINRASVEYEYDTGPLTRFANPLKPTNVGFGISYCLPIVVAVLSSQPGDTLLIENPESHLHPRGQSRLGKLLALAAAGGVQTIIETHSDHILNGIRLAVKQEDIACDEVAIFSFDRVVADPEHNVEVLCPRIDRDGKIDRWPAGFFDEAENLLFELM